MKRGKRCCHLSRPVSRGVGNPDRLRESLVLWTLRFANKEVIYPIPSLPSRLSSPFEVPPLPSLSITYPVAPTAQVSARLRMRTSFPSAHSPFTRFSKQRRTGGQQVPRALCPTHLSRSKCSSPVPPNAPISRQRYCVSVQLCFGCFAIE